jgi:hypothetical protein
MLCQNYSLMLSTPGRNFSKVAKVAVSANQKSRSIAIALKGVAEELWSRCLAYELIVVEKKSINKMYFTQATFCRLGSEHFRKYCVKYVGPGYDNTKWSCFSLFT